MDCLNQHDDMRDWRFGISSVTQGTDDFAPRQSPSNTGAGKQPIRLNFNKHGPVTPGRRDYRCAERPSQEGKQKKSCSKNRAGNNI